MDGVCRMTINQKIENIFPELTASERKVARYILENSAEAAFMTMDRIARKTGVSTTTVIRLSYRLGYSGFQELKAHLRKLVTAQISLEKRLAKTQPAKDGKNGNASLERDIQNLLKLDERLQIDEVTAVAEKIVSADFVYICAFRTSLSVAIYLYSILTKIIGFRKVHLLSYEARPEQFGAIEAEDLLLVIDYPRYLKKTIKIIQQVKKKGTTVVAITDSRLSRLAHTADYTLSTPFESTTFHNSMVAPIAMINVLIATIISLVKEDVLSSIKNSEAILYEWDTFELEY